MTENQFELGLWGFFSVGVGGANFKVKLELRIAAMLPKTTVNNVQF